MKSEGDTMISTAKDINPRIKELRSIIRKESEFQKTRQLCLNLHTLAHHDFFDIECNHYEQAVMPTPQDVTIVWNLWHISRIEEMIVSTLILHREELFDHWQKKLNTNYRDTGNAMSDDEIIDLSRQVDFQQLKAYRIAVAKQTLQYLEDLKFSDLNMKVKKADIDKLLSAGSVSPHPDAIWLLDSWGKKDVAGLLLMPILRHPFVHLFDNLKLMEKIKKMPKHLVDIE